MRAAVHHSHDYEGNYESEVVMRYSPGHHCVQMCNGERVTARAMQRAGVRDLTGYFGLAKAGLAQSPLKSLPRYYPTTSPTIIRPRQVL